jgi:hypothetical protein
MYINSYADKRNLLSYGICSGYSHAAAAEQESVRKSTKEPGATNQKKRPPEGDRLVIMKPQHYQVPLSLRRA